MSVLVAIFVLFDAIRSISSSLGGSVLASATKGLSRVGNVATGFYFLPCRSFALANGTLFVRTCSRPTEPSRELRFAEDFRLWVELRPTAVED